MTTAPTASERNLQTPSLGRVKARLAAQEAQLRAAEVRYVDAGILKPEEIRFATAADLWRAPIAEGRSRQREGRAAPARRRALARSTVRRTISSGQVVELAKTTRGRRGASDERRLDHGPGPEGAPRGAGLLHSGMLTLLYDEIGTVI